MIESWSSLGQLLEAALEHLAGRLVAPAAPKVENAGQDVRSGPVRPVAVYGLMFEPRPSLYQVLSGFVEPFEIGERAGDVEMAGRDVEVIVAK